MLGSWLQWYPSTTSSELRSGKWLRRTRYTCSVRFVHASVLPVLMERMVPPVLTSDSFPVNPRGGNLRRTGASVQASQTAVLFKWRSMMATFSAVCFPSSSLLVFLLRFRVFERRVSHATRVDRPPVLADGTHSVLVPPESIRCMKEGFQLTDVAHLHPQCDVWS